MQKILVTGANGQLGSEIKSLADSVPFEFLFTDVEELDLTNAPAIETFLDSNPVDVIVNCAAYTAVDRAEQEIELADRVNHLAPKFLALEAKKRNLKFIHVSTDYVFDGENFRPYRETDHCNPKNIYGKTKWDGERAVLEVGLPNSMIIRTSWVYSSFGHNFVKTMRRLGKERPEINVVNDQIGSPTFAQDLAACILDSFPKLKNSSTEVYHFSNEGICSWFDFAKAIMEMSEIPCKVNPIPSSQYPTPAKRPFYSVLDKSKIKKDFGITIPYWRDSLAACLGLLD
ncbi:dTDP-4-dehydrorhamnose reductase [Algoriphagus mannitolivorans]|uniref:dTDP-4-dehydrorhamnose reductase n=1 Tax=Algoriphagus mannitolivorans TaxID=226504 RepID=UPI0003F8E5FF|nr:dTDP-4-dehydrorhamnose reductase [Algoriphagus mannitolivorans]